MNTFSLVQRSASRDLYTPLTHIAQRAEWGPMKTANHGLCDFPAGCGWGKEWPLTEEELKRLRNIEDLCPECDVKFGEGK